MTLPKSSYSLYCCLVYDLGYKKFCSAAQSTFTHVFYRSLVTAVRQANLEILVGRKVCSDLPFEILMKVFFVCILRSLGRVPIDMTWKIARTITCRHVGNISGDWKIDYDLNLFGAPIDPSNLP